MTNLILETCRKVERWLAASANPVVLWSGGKDSTAMLHLIRHEVGVKTPVVQWREPRFRTRYAHSDRLAAEWDLEMYDWTPRAYALTDGYDIESGQPRFDFVKCYEMAPNKVMFLCLGTEEPKAEELASGRYLCGLDALRRPTGTFEFPWDSAFHGQKSADVDLIKGQVPLAQDALVQAGVPTQYYPMRHWSDSDVWAYLEAANVPNDDTRYQKINGEWQHKADKANNSDYYPVCWSCVNRHLGDTVYCPKQSCETNNISHLAPYVDLTSEAQGFRPTWETTTVRGVAHAALTSGAGQSYDETEAMLSASRNGCLEMTTP